MRRIFHNRAVAVLAASQSVSGIGNWITMLSLFSIIVFYGHGSVLQTSGVLLAGYAPMILCSPLAGWLCDRFNRKWIMIASEVCSGLAVVGIILSRRLELIYALLVLQSASSSFLPPATQSALPTVVEKTELTQANALLQQISSGIKIGAPLLAGFLLSFLSPQQAMILDVISYALSALILSTLPALPPQRAQQTSATENGETLPTPGMRVFLPQLVILFVMTFFLVLILGCFDLLAPTFIRDTLKQQASTFGLLIACVGLGAVIGSLWLLVRKGKPHYWRDIILGVILLTMLPGATVLASFAPAPLLALMIMVIGCLVGGVGQGFSLVQSGTLLQLLAPGTMLGRVSGIFQSTMAVAQLICLLGIPWIVPIYLSITAIFLISAIAMALLTVITILILYRDRVRSQLIPSQDEVDPISLSQM
ncbi:MFS transporter [Tengunoibacter tsumagoiensis]|uniref:MFS transporter n=1 Tax=Tengunoibacter tsumagoiensis TaxID=2014871 RepID=A0A402A425_9CHLR|nr:MFS transporter [Tengunoibacter tsumagoiensis]GCE13806.1 MFS transporter [Tengunoibacter tsumagoiensis]